jgi:hypothetical protein
MLNPKVALIRGNRVVVAWYTSNENEYEIKVMTGQILDAPEVSSKVWPTATPIATFTPTPVEISPTPTQIPPFVSSSGEPQSIDPGTPGTVVIIGSIPVILLIAGVIIIKILRSGNRL